MPDETPITLRELMDERWLAHQRAHTDWQEHWEVRTKEHQNAHGSEHKMTQAALDKAESGMSLQLQVLTNRMETGDHILATQITTAVQALQDRIEAGDKTLALQLKALSDQLAALKETQVSMLARGAGAGSTIIWIFAGLSAISAILGSIAIVLHFVK